MPFKPDASTRVIKTSSGDLQTVPVQDADQVAGQGGNAYATLDEIAAANRAEQYGTAGQTAIGAAEEATRTATFGAIPGFGSPEDVRGRQEQLQSEHPIVSAAAQGVGALVPAAAAAATGGALGAAAGLGEAAGGVLSAGLEGTAAGGAAEADQAFAEKRKFSVGNALMFGLGGEIVGRALPAALALGAGRIRRALSPLEAAAGEGLEEVGGESSARAMASRAKAAVDMSPGPERSAAMRETAPIQMDDAAEAISSSLQTAARAKESTTGELVHAQLSELLPEDSPAQIRWATAQSEAAADARLQIKSLGGDYEAETVLRDLADGFDSTTDRAKWLSHGFTTEQELAKQGARDLPQPILDVLSEVQGRLNNGITDPSLWGESASLVDDLQRASASGLDNVTVELGGTGFDPATVKEMLTSGDPIARKTLEDAAESLENLSEVHKRYGTANDTEIEAMRDSATALRDKMSVVDEVQRVSPTDNAPASLVSDEVPDLQSARRIVDGADQETFRLRDLAGGTAKSKGAVQDFFDRLQEVANNGVKRTDFAKFQKSLSPEGRAYVQQTTGELAASAREVLPSLPKGTRGKLEGFIAKAENARSTSTLDELKNALQAMRKKAAAQSTHSVEAQGIVDAIDPVEQKIRTALEDPKIVGTKVAKLQQTRNNFWANKETGYIRNSGQLKAAGYDLSDIVERDYDGKIVLQSDRRAIDKLINDPEHLTRPALDALDNMVASAQQMIKDTAASGAASADRSVNAEFAKSAAQLKEYVDGVRRLSQAKSIVERAGPEAVAGPSRAQILGGLAEHLPVVGRAIKFARHAREAGEALAEAESPAMGRARAAADKLRSRETQSGAVDIGGRTSPVDLTGKSVEDLNALPLEGESDLRRVADITANPEFKKSGRFSANNAQNGITVVQDGDQLVLRDGRHRFQAAKDLGRESVWGRVVDGESGEEVFQGEIPINKSSGFADTGATGEGVKGILTSPMALTAGIGGAAAATYGLAKSNAAPNTGVNMQSIQDAATTLSKTTARVLAGVSRPRASASLAGASLQRFTSGYATPEASFEAKKKVLMAVGNDPTILSDTIAASTGSLAEQHPELFAQMAGRISAGINYVAQNLPPGIASSLLHPDGMPPARSALRDTAVLWNTVFHPETVYDDIQARVATSQQMRALESQHPDLYAQLKQDAIEQIGTQFRSVPHGTKAYVDILFDTDGMAGPMYSSYAAQQIGIAQSERQGQSGRSTLATNAGKAHGAPETSGVAAIKSSVTNRGTAP